MERFEITNTSNSCPRLNEMDLSNPLPKLSNVVKTPFSSVILGTREILLLFSDQLEIETALPEIEILSYELKNKYKPNEGLIFQL